MQGDSLPNTKKRSAALDPDQPLCDRVIGAAFGAFMANGYAGTSMLEIATRAKISKRDLYANFPSKQAVLLACITSRAARMRLPVDLPAPQSRAMLKATLTAFGTTVIQEVCEPAATSMHRLAIAEAERSPDVAAAISAHRSANRHALEQLLVRAQAAGVLGQGNSPRMMEQFFALLWGDLLISRLLGVVRVPSRDQIEQRVNEAVAAFLKLYPNSRS